MSILFSVAGYRIVGFGGFLRIRLGVLSLGRGIGGFLGFCVRTGGG